MAATERERHEVYVALEGLLGPQVTSTLMGMIAPELPHEMAAMRSELRGEMAELRGEMVAFRAEVRGEIAEVRGEIAELRGEMAAFRTEIDAQFDALPARLFIGNVVLAISTAGLVLGAASLA